jgi:parallel beta-helix repeat protein
MKKGIVLGIVYLFIGMSFISIAGNQINNQTIKPSGRGDILYVGGSGPGNYTRIQDAIDNASNGDTIFVNNGTYYENLIVDESIFLTGENPENTIIDGGGKGDIVKIKVDEIQFSGFTCQNSGVGLDPDHLENAAIKVTSNNNKIYNVICLDTNYAIWVFHSNENIIENNTCYGTYDGIWLDESKNNILRNNSMFDSGLVLQGLTLPVLVNDIDTSNTANDKPVYYYLNQTDIKVPKDAGQVILINCNKCVISDLRIFNVTDGIALLYSNRNIIRNNTVAGATDFGIQLYKSNYNLIVGNNCSNNIVGIAFMGDGFTAYNINADCKYNKIVQNTINYNKYFGLWIVMSHFNKIYKNNFIGNKIENARFILSFGNHWFNNYWDDWIGHKYKLLRCCPYAISGSLFRELYMVTTWLKFDIHPAKIPYEFSNAQCYDIE